VDVILDYGFWSRTEREEYRARAKQLGSRSQIHFLEVSQGEFLARLARRNADHSQTVFHIPPELVERWPALFQPPAAEELEPRA
jgi:predicted kinase